MLEALILKVGMELGGLSANENKLRTLITGLLMSSPALISERSHFPTGLGRYDYDLVYTGLSLADVHLEFKDFAQQDFPSMCNNLLLQRLLRQHQGRELYTMEFGFDVKDTAIIENTVGSFYKDAVFRTIGVFEDGRIRPVYSMMDANKNQANDTIHTFYDRSSSTVIMQNEGFEEICSDTYERETFTKILDPLSIVLELITRQPQISDEELDIGLFYNQNAPTHLFPVTLRLVQEGNRRQIEYHGEIELPAGVFLADSSILVRNEYVVTDTTLVPNIKYRLFLRPNSGLTSYAPGWARTEIRE